MKMKKQSDFTRQVAKMPGFAENKTHYTLCGKAAAMLFTPVAETALVLSTYLIGLLTVSSRHKAPANAAGFLRQALSSQSAVHKYFWRLWGFVKPMRGLTKQRTIE